MTTAVLLLAGCGSSADECGTCDPGFVCYFGTCVPDLDAPGADADADPDGRDIPEAETPGEGGPDADADGDPDVAEVPADGPADVPADVPPDVPPACPDPVAHDEDGDGFDDACDLCPTFPDPEQLDGDGDGLGDACEALDAALLSRIDAFAAFVDNRLVPAAPWVASGDGWTPAADVVTGSASPYGADRWLEQRADAPYAVEAQFRLREAPLTGSNYTGLLFGVQRGTTGTSVTWWGCFFEWDDRTLSLWRNDGRAIQYVAGAAAAVESNGTTRDVLRRLRATWDGLGVGCTFDNELGEHGELLERVERWSAASLDGAGGLRVYNETSVFHSFVLYR
jgi:hypothetical protein